jgi:hypothetical protein
MPASEDETVLVEKIPQGGLPDLAVDHGLHMVVVVHGQHHFHLTAKGNREAHVDHHRPLSLRVVQWRV